MITGIAVTSGPWLLTTALLVLMRMSAVAAGIDTVTQTERIVTVVYATVIVLAAPIDIILTRFSADRVYEKRRDQIAAPLCRVLALGCALFAIVGGIVMFLAGASIELAIPGAVLAVIVGAQWLLVSAAGGLSSPGIILKAFGLGPLVSVLAWLVMMPMELGAAAYLYGFAAGQVVTLGLLLWGTLSALPEWEDESADISRAVKSYWVMALAAFAFNAGLWADKLIVVLQQDSGVPSQYAALAAVAWLTVIPAFGYLYVRVETSFHRRFQAFYQSMTEGASLPQLERLSSRLGREVKQTLLGTFWVQITVTLLSVALAPMVLRALHLNGLPIDTIYWLLFGVALQVVAVSSILILYYFDFRGEALAAAMTQLTTNVIFTTLFDDTLGAGYAVACLFTAAVGVGLVLRSLPCLLPRTFRSQIDLLESA